MQEELISMGDHVVMPPAHRDDATGAVWVHKDYSTRIGSFAAQEHIAPIRENLILMNIPSWAAYVRRYGTTEDTLLTHNKRGIHAVLDYHVGDDPGRCQWSAHYQYPFTEIYKSWFNALDSRPISHESMVFLLDDSAPYVEATDITDSAAIMQVISTLRITTQSQAETEIRGDGSTAVKWSRDTSVRGSKEGEAQIPPELRLSIPIIGDARINFTVRLRLAINDRDNKVAFVLTSRDFEKATDDALATEVQVAETALGDFGVPILWTD